MKHSVPQPTTFRPQPLPRLGTECSPHAAHAEELWTCQLAQSLGVAKEELEAFARLMQGHRWPVNIARLFLDSRYAFKCFALAHTSTDEELRHLTLILFEGYQRLETRRKNLCLGRLMVH
jgi:hypothetical protein